ncbi:MFS transporter [Serratia rubidaea]|uniref:MFS transporter n=1 Tax=Serratia rubidaea TaxID=61652 RepID=UPI001BAF067B|nr:MFS transporter [Serratia rubidaea]MBS0971950.1 MFS transporter [Serratia rubidaea]
MPLSSVQALCLLSFFMSDVRDGLGPFLGVFLINDRWSAEDIGYVMTAGGIAGLVATLPAGILADATAHKRLLVSLAALLIMSGTLLLWFFPHPLMVYASQVTAGVSAALIGPLMAGLTLGLVGQRLFAHQLGRNEAYNHGGNMLSALLAGAASWFWGLGAVFLLMIVMTCGALMAAFAIREQDIDHRVARGLKPDETPAQMPSLATLVKMPALMLTGLTLLLFHLSNAAQLPMLSMQVASGEQARAFNPGLYAAMTVVIAQCVMIPVALLVSRYVRKYGYQKLILLALMVLPVRAMTAALWPSPWAAIPVQIFDGLSAGILGVAVPGFIASLLNGTGHVNAGQALVMLVQGFGAALSPAVAGAIATHYSWRDAFMSLAGIAVMALLIWLTFSGRRRPLAAVGAPQK